MTAMERSANGPVSRDVCRDEVSRSLDGRMADAKGIFVRSAGQSAVPGTQTTTILRLTMVDPMKDDYPFSRNVPVEQISLLDAVNNKCKEFTSKLKGLDLKADISTLMLPTVGAINESRFDASGEYYYVRRKGIMESLGAAVNEWRKNGKQPLTRNVLGFKRSGKSYTMATFASALRNYNYKVLYIHNCSYWAAMPLDYLRAEALSTFYGDSVTQQRILDASTIDAILRLLTDAKVIVVADQVDGLCQRHNLPGRNQVQTTGSLEVLRAIEKLSLSTLVFTAASGRKTRAFVECFNNCDEANTIRAFEGFSRDEFEIFRQRVPAFSGLDEEAVEKLERLTGFLPGLLTLPRSRPEFRLSPTPVPSTETDDDSWITPIQDKMTEFVSTCMTNTEKKHKDSHEAAVYGTKYTGDRSLINFDIVSIPDVDNMVACPSLFCKDVLSDHMAMLDHEHKKNRLVSLRVDIENTDQEPTKVGDAVEDYLVTHMEVHKQCPMQLPNTASTLFPEGHIPLTECKKFTGTCPALMELTGDYERQHMSNEPIAYGYFPSGKFLRYIDFVVRAFIKQKAGQKDLMVVVAGKITLSQPVDHSHTWKFFERDYVEWQAGYDASKVDTKFVLAWFTPHIAPDLDPYNFENETMEGTTINVPFGSFTAKLGAVLSPLCNPDRYKCCSCTTLCPKQCGCRKAHIPCRANCTCGNAAECNNPFTWTS